MSRGPDTAKLALWRRRLRECEQGTETVAAFCGRLGVSLASYYHWRQKVLLTKESSTAEKMAAESRAPARAQSRGAVPALSFLPVEITGGARSVIEVLLPNGARVLIPGGEHEALRIAIAAAAGIRATGVAAETQPC